MNQIVKTDLVIVGGGIAGLWVLHRARQAGFSAILLESATIGGGQTHQSQGIIHGGMKYALQGHLTKAAKTISTMPAIWKACFSGQGEIDLLKAKVLAEQQTFWSTGTLASDLISTAAHLALKSDTQLLNRNHFPVVFKNSAFQGKIYLLDEIVVDIESVLRELVAPYSNAIFKIDPLLADQIISDEKNKIISLDIRAAAKKISIHAQRFIFTAGSGNCILPDKFPDLPFQMQSRPLHMVIMKHAYDYPLYGHCLGMGNVPRLTISTHKAKDGKTIWYMGGQLAEEGVSRTSYDQIKTTQQELKKLFSWIDFSKAEFASFFVDRAEGKDPAGKRPDSCTIQSAENIIAAWPTKLAFAPLLADNILQSLHVSPLHPQPSLLDWPTPAIAQPIWDQLLP